MDAKKMWNHHFEAYIRDLDKKKPVIWTGDLNVAPTAIGSSPPFSPKVLRHSQDIYRPWQSEDKLEQNGRLYRSRDNGVCQYFKLPRRRRCGQVRRCLAKASPGRSSLHLLFFSIQLPRERYRVAARHV
jgi:hypothetical protein